MAMRSSYDAVVVGAGPNGLAAAITLAQAGCSVLLVEAEETVGGGLRSAELTLPGFTHDICSAIYPLGVGSPFFQALPLAQHGLEWIYPPAALAHPRTMARRRCLSGTRSPVSRRGRHAGANVWLRVTQAYILGA